MELSTYVHCVNVFPLRERKKLNHANRLGPISNQRLLVIWVFANKDGVYSFNMVCRGCLKFLELAITTFSSDP